MSITDRRKRAFAEGVLRQCESPIGFADVGSGGPLKAPWSHLPQALVHKFDFEPTGSANAGIPLCVSDHVGSADLHVAVDERASSLHVVDPHFVARFDLASMRPASKIRVDLTTLDEHFAGRFSAVDALDVNVEGHDLQVLNGGRRLLETGFPKLIKVEFELTQVYHDQGWFSDIDGLLRAGGFDLANIEVEFARSVRVRNIFNKGEPLWGKAYYVPSERRWSAVRGDPGCEAHAAKAIALLVAADLPGRAFDILDNVPLQNALDRDVLRQQIRHVFGWAAIEHGLRLARHYAGRAAGLLLRRA